MGCAKILQREFHFKHFKCYHETPVEFIRSQWQNTSKCLTFLIYRWILAIFFCSNFIYAAYDHVAKGRNFGKLFIYLTNWGIVLCMVCTVLGALLVTTCYYSQAQQEKLSSSVQTPSIFKLYWAIHNVSLIVSILITVVYWSVLYKSDKDQLDARNILGHICNAIVMLIDLIIVAHPVRIVHVIQPVGFGIVYAIFTYVYFLSGGTNNKGEPYIYSILNWDDPLKVILVILTLICFCMILHFLLWAVCLLRTSFCKYFKKDSLVESKSQTDIEGVVNQNFHMTEFDKNCNQTMSEKS